MQERGGRLPQRLHPWVERLAQDLMQHDDPARVVEGIKLAGQLRLGSLFEPLAAIAAGREGSAAVRIAALEACVATGDPRRCAVFNTVLGDPDETFDIRRAAALALSLVNTDESRKLLRERLEVAHHRLATDIAAALATGRPGAELLLAAIREGKASRLLLREPSVLRRLEAARVPDFAQRLKELTANLPPQDQLTARVIKERREAYLSAKPDAVRGRKIFKDRCAICHQLGNEGKKFGPDLDGIGARGLDRLLEDLLDPNRNVDPTFRTTNVLTDDGLTLSGLALRDEGNVLILVDNEGNEKRISHDEIDERWVSPLSPMPNAAEKTVSPVEFSHLLRYLLKARQATDAREPAN
jgi:putative heme-binding domain-containing protein